MATRQHDPELEHLAEKRATSHSGLAGFIVGTLVAAAAALLIVQNRSEAALQWMTFEVEGPLWVFLALSFVAGIVAAPLLLAGWHHQRDKRAQRRRIIADARR
jgi:uncharacterized integral membrane protein